MKGEAFPWDAWWRFARIEAHMDAHEFWGSTVAQIAALLPDLSQPSGPVEQGTGADLIALAT